MQRASYAIAEQADVDQPMSALTQALPGIISSLLYAENFYIVLYDAVTQNVRFPCYIDTIDANVPLPDLDIPLQSMAHSLTWTLLRTGQPMLGSPEEFRQRLGADMLPLNSQLRALGSVCHCLRGGNVRGRPGDTELPDGFPLIHARALVLVAYCGPAIVRDHAFRRVRARNLEVARPGWPKGTGRIGGKPIRFLRPQGPCSARL